MPRSRSRSFESITRSATCWFARKIWLCLSIASTTGCGVGKYCPNSNVLRDQMASFLARTLDFMTEVRSQPLRLKADTLAFRLGVTDAERTMPGGTITGTLRYLSPEQARGEEATHKADIWATGAVLGELCRDAELGRYCPETAAFVESVSGQRLPVEFLSDGPPLAQQTVMLKALGFDSLEANAYDAQGIQVLSLAYDGLVGYRRTGGTTFGPLVGNLNDVLAAAGLLAAAATTTGDAAFLFSTDEEANDARCIAGFLDTTHGFEQAIVAEPTRCEAVLAHRGISSVLLRFRGEAGHASGSSALEANALHHAMRWGTRALELVEGEAHRRFGGLTGLRFNVGRVEGGIKANVIAPAAEVRFGFRPLPSQDIDELHTRFGGCATTGTVERYEETFRGPSLPSGDVAAAEEQRLAARDLADELGLPIGNAVDFWTEASLFSRAGMTALVYGPGDIAQAHAADEWVSLRQLARYAGSVARILQ